MEVAVALIRRGTQPKAHGGNPTWVVSISRTKSRKSFAVRGRLDLAGREASLVAYVMASEWEQAR